MAKGNAMKVKVTDTLGFCFGVRRAIELAEAAIAERGPGKVVALGPIVHNRQVVEELERAGLDQAGDLESIDPSQAVLIRSHGAAPDTYRRAQERGLEIVDATCPLVKRAQEAVERLHEENYRVVMIGDRNHPEVRSVVSYAPNVTVIGDVAEIEASLPADQPLGIVAQTTIAPERLAEITAAIRRQTSGEIKEVNTLCGEVTRRQKAAVTLAREVDVMFVLGGLDSANTRELAGLCTAAGCPTYHLETWDQFDRRMIADRKSAGVTAGTSTSDEVVAEFAGNVETL
ncbi:MAG: 4-hydroxy-3-methylbut-2-enyl diphosphate reductase [Planctomycetes bacterium]|nr:4-hydroxy-3-methylbut-2-enyl diphosphate reductase [Planctomycetota bacterium]